jgi:hypothetical protein
LDIARGTRQDDLAEHVIARLIEKARSALPALHAARARHL